MQGKNRKIDSDQAESFNKDEIKDAEVLSLMSDEVDETVEPIISVIGAGLVVNGDVVGDGILQVNGRVNGNIIARDVIIGEKGVVSGNISAFNIRLFGKILSGKIVAEEVFVSSNSAIHADVDHARIGIEPGALVNGLCKQVVRDSVIAFRQEKIAEYKKKNN